MLRRSLGESAPSRNPLASACGIGLCREDGFPEDLILARRFLWLVAMLIMLVLAAAILYRLYGAELIRFTMVPKAPFQAGPPPAQSAYARKELWLARPGMAEDPSQWTPPGVTSAGPLRASVFFIHPTSYLQTSRWNAPLDDPESQWRARLFVRSQASAFNGIGEIWAPKYRQATFGAFLTTEADAQKALAFAYRDVAAAFEEFLREAPEDRPIILAGHSQGSLHLMRLLAERIAGRPEAKRIAAAYVIGWPVSLTADLPALGLPGCERPGQPGCILSWQSFAEPADPKMVTDVYDASMGPTGVSRAGSPMLCVNPLTGARGGEAPAEANLGTLVPNKDLTAGELKAPGVPARCDPRGFLLIGEDGPDLGAYVLPGNNYHVYDYALFWANIRADAAARLAAWEGK
jgi:pimeloyl-ACP methyl ester carboxylesterase